LVLLALSYTGTLKTQAPTTTAGIVVPAGTDVKLRFIEGLSSGKVHVGDPITLELAEDLTVALSAAWLAAAALSGWSTAARPMNALPAATGTARNA
jgi:hypothetical protein